jgi:hypothetical protein
MRLAWTASALFVLVLVSTVTFRAQSLQRPAEVTAPRLVQVSGVFRPADGQPPAAAEVVTLAIYADESGGAPLWQETQSIAVDAEGRYALLLGSTERDGLPVDLFASGEARWFTMTFARPGEAEGPRTRLASVPYALHASSADTLGGLPASAYMLAPSARRPGGGEDGAHVVATGDSGTIDTQAVLPGTTNFLAKYINNADVGNSAVFESGGFVGVGTNAPVDRLHVQFNNGTGQFTGYAVQNLGNTASSYSGMLFYDQNGALGQFQGFNNATHEYRINNIARRAADNLFDGTINFLIGSTSRFFVSSAGLVGINTTLPLARLTVAGETGIPPVIEGRGTRGTQAAPSGVLNGDLLAFFSAGGTTSDPANRYTSGRAGIQMRAAADFTTDTSPAYMDFYTSPNTPNASAAPRMRIDENGNVGIGTGSLPPADRLQVVGDVRVGTSGSNGCVKNFNGDALVGTCSSDRRFKKDVIPFGPALTSVAALQPVHYYWRAAAFPERHFGDRRAYGLLAQEVEKVLPELVLTDADGYKAVDYSKLPLLTVQAVKELKAENDAVKAMNAALEDRVQQLERKMQELSAALARK